MAIESINNGMNYQVQQPAKDAAVRESGNITEEIPEIAITDVNTSSQVAETSGENKEGDNGQPTYEQIKKAIDTINKKANNSTVQFGIHEATNRITIKIVDKDSKKVIREVPAEKTLDMIAKAWELAGMIVDEKR